MTLRKSDTFDRAIRDRAADRLAEVLLQGRIRERLRQEIEKCEARGVRRDGLAPAERKENTMTVVLYLYESGELKQFREITEADGNYISEFIPDDMTVRNMSIVGAHVHVYLHRKEAA